MNDNKCKKFPNLNFYLMTSIIGALRGGAGLVLEHPLDSIKTQWQNKVEIKSPLEIIKNIYEEKGFMGFYRGFIPNFIRVTSKQVYRWPMMLYFPKFFDKRIHSDLKMKFDGLVKILTGLSIANFEIFIICPLDRLKVYSMTVSINKIKHVNMFVYFYQNNKDNLIREVFRGLEPFFWKQNVSWVSFLYLDHKLKRLFKDYKQIDNLSMSDLFYISILVALGNLVMSK